MFSSATSLSCRAGQSQVQTASPWWRTGSAEAQRELRSGVATPLVDGKAAEVQWSRFGSGEQARICQFSFDESQAESWK